MFSPSNGLDVTTCWVELLTNFNTSFKYVTNHAVSGAAVLDYPECPHVIPNDYDRVDAPHAPSKAHTNGFFVLHGSHNSIYGHRYTVDEVFAATSNVLTRARSQGFITVGCTLAPSKLLIDSGVEGNRLLFNARMRGATNLWNLLMDWDAILPHNLSDTNYYIDRAHPGRAAAKLLAASFQELARHADTGRITMDRGPGPVVLRWQGYEMLQHSDGIDGPYTDLGILIGPFTPAMTNRQEFFRLRLLP